MYENLNFVFCMGVSDNLFKHSNWYVDSTYGFLIKIDEKYQIG